MDTTVRKDELLHVVRGNRDKHRTVFEAALAGYREHALLVLDEQVKALSDGKTPEIRIVLGRPQDHTRDYDRVITMLQMEVANQVTLDEEMFARFVMDDWTWKRQWLRMSSHYAAAETSRAYGDISDEE